MHVKQKRDGYFYLCSKFKDRGKWKTREIYLGNQPSAESALSTFQRDLRRLKQEQRTIKGELKQHPGSLRNLYQLDRIERQLEVRQRQVGRLGPLVKQVAKTRKHLLGPKQKNLVT